MEAVPKAGRSVKRTKTREACRKGRNKKTHRPNLNVQPAQLLPNQRTLLTPLPHLFDRNPKTRLEHLRPNPNSPSVSTTAQLFRPALDNRLTRSVHDPRFHLPFDPPQIDSDPQVPPSQLLRSPCSRERLIEGGKETFEDDLTKSSPGGVEEEMVGQRLSFDGHEDGWSIWEGGEYDGGWVEEVVAGGGAVRVGVGVEEERIGGRKRGRWVGWHGC